jgi:ABC-2 type transport system ATP-binding protein
MDEFVVTTKGLTKRYGDRLAVDGVSMTVRRGEVYGFLGPNGAGKTTTLRMALGLVRPTAGSVRILGEAAGSPSVTARVGALIEGPGFYPSLSGRDNLRVLARYRGLPESAADGALARVDLADRGSDRFRSYSLGMKQRLGVAAALMGSPELIVLDEPTNGLDPPQIHAMREVLRSYAATGRTVIVSSHLLSEIEQTCSHVVVMAKGQKIAQGTVEEIVGTGGAVSVGLVDDAETAHAIAVLEGLPGVSAEQTDEGLVADLDGTSRARALQALVEAGIEVDAFTPRRRLEDAFLALVGEEHS